MQLQRHLLSMSSESSGVVDVMATLEHAVAAVQPPPTTLQQTAGQLSISPVELPIPMPVDPPPHRNRAGSGASSGSPTGQHGQSRPPADGTSGGNDDSGKNGSGQHNSCQASNPEQQPAPEGGADAGPTNVPAALGSTDANPATNVDVSPPLLSGYSSVPPGAFPHSAAAAPFSAYGAMAPGGMAAVDPVQAWYHQHYSSMMMSHAGGMFGRAAGGLSKGGEAGMAQWCGFPMSMFGQAGMPTASLARTSSKATRTKRSRSMDMDEEPSAR